MAAVGELILSAFHEVLFDKLTSGDVLNFARQLHGGVHSELKEWDQKLKMINGVLRDAEDKQLTYTAVKLWLDNLQDLGYDAEDILDEFAYEALRRKLVADQTITSKVKNLIPDRFKRLRFSADMVSKIKEITSRLEQLFNLRVQLGLQVISGGTSSTAAPQRLESSSVPTEQVVYGREEDKAKILEMVQSSEPSDSNFRVIPILGMGGIGKTTLARDVYNDKALGDFKFNIKAWVCVSDNFDVLRISKALLESITHSPCNLRELNEVQVQLRKGLEGKKFLLVLDDVWNEKNELWEALTSPFNAGARGSKIIVTTRSEYVASTKGFSEPYKLKHVSGQDCWCLFPEYAFGTGRDTDAHGIPDSTRERVIKKCGGLPLAAKTLGGLLHYEENGKIY